MIKIKSEKKCIDDNEHLQRVLDKTGGNDECRILSEKEAEKFIEENF